MPRLCEFYGITICIYFKDHNPPHFHAYYAEHEVEIAIESLEVLAGELPRRAMSLVVEWAMIRRPELRRAWTQASVPTAVDSIEPLF
jgi:hypothetical protein